MSSIKIKKIGITKLHVDAIVNAANGQLAAGGGVCGAIFKEAGYNELTAACRKAGYCKTGSAKITPGFNLPCKYIIHAVGPIWSGGDRKEPQLLYGCYKEALNLAMKSGCRSIAFPLISSGIFGYPVGKAWRKALQACNDFIDENIEYDIDIIFAVLSDNVLDMGLKELTRQQEEKDSKLADFLSTAVNSKDPHLGGCQNLEKAINEFFLSNQENPKALVEAIIDELKNDIEVLVPMEEHAENDETSNNIDTSEEIVFTPRIIDNEDGTVLYPVFTSMCEVMRGEDTSTCPMLLSDIMEAALNTADCAGISINPFSDSPLEISIEGITGLMNGINTGILDEAISIPCTQDMIDLEEGADAYNRGDFETAFKLYTKSAAAGNITALSNLGYCYYYGRSVPVDKEKAKECWERAAILGDLNSIYKLGDMYRNGDMEKDLAYSKALYKRAFDLSAEYGDIYNIPDIILRLLKYCKDDYDPETLIELANEAEEQCRERIEEGDNFTQKVYDELLRLKDELIKMQPLG